MARTTRAWGGAALAFAVSMSLAGCITANDVTLAGVWDTEAADKLTNQRDVTSEICGVVSNCLEAVEADQGMFFKFESASAVQAEVQPGDDVMRDVFVLRWNEGVPHNDREYVKWVLDNAGQSGSYEPTYT